MKQVLRKGRREIVVEDVPDPVLASHHVLIHSAVSLISSGTETASIHRESLVAQLAENPSHLRRLWDVMKVAGPARTLTEARAKLDEYAVLGYSGAGVIAAVHRSVADLSVGARVAYGGEGTGHGETVLAARNLVARVPDTVRLEDAAFTTLGSIALNAVRTAGLGLGETVAVLGLGLVGQLVAQVARLQGAIVIGVDLRAERVELAKALGADEGTASLEALAELVASRTSGRGVDCVIIAAASKSADPCRQALSLCRDRGRIVVVGAVDLSFPWHEMYLKEIELRMSRAYGPGSYDATYEREGRDYPLPYVRWTENRNMEEFLRLVELGRVQLGSLVTHEFPLGQAADGYATIMDPGSRSLAVLLRYPATPLPDASALPPVRRIEVTPADRHPTGRTGDLRVAVIGAGNLARWAHLPNLRRMPGVALRAICSTSGARGRTYAARFGATYCCSDYAEVLRDPDVDVVLILTRNQHHASQALAALEAGKHVFVEKPMALTTEECRALVRAVDAGQGSPQLTVGFNRRYAPFYLDQKQALRGRTGPVVVTCRVNSPGISGDYWMADPAIGGAVLGEACHFIDLMYWLLESEPIRVAAFSLPGGTPDHTGENSLVASLTFADGSIANLTYCTVGSRTSGGERVEVFAPGLGVATEDFKRLTVSKGRRTTQSRWWPEKGYSAQLASFLDSVRARRAPEVTVRDGARATIACLRLLEAARDGDLRAIDLDAALRGSELA